MSLILGGKYYSHTSRPWLLFSGAEERQLGGKDGRMGALNSRGLERLIVIVGCIRQLYTYLKPESVRAHPEATVRPWAIVQVVGDALSFASALGYKCVPLRASSRY